MSAAAPVSETVISAICTKDQLEALDIDITNLLERCEEGELDLILEQDSKTVKQKATFIATMIRELGSDILADALRETLIDKGELDFFSGVRLLPFLKDLERQAGEVVIIPLTLAIPFEEPDLKEMAALLTPSSGRHVALDVKVDRSIIGGAIVRYGTYLTDYSVRSRLDQFRAHWRKAVVSK